jgi:hypothetical protein
MHFMYVKKDLIYPTPVVRVQSELDCAQTLLISKHGMSKETAAERSRT